MKTINVSYPIYLISLEKDKYRRENLRKNFILTYDQFLHIEAIDGRHLNAKDYFDLSINFSIKNSRIMTPSELGCTLSHIKALKEFIASKKDFGLIIEDDIIGIDEDIHKIEKALANLPKNSILLCGGQEGLISKQYQYGREIKKNLYKVSRFSYDYIYRTCCYVVTQESARVILNSHEKYIKLADNWGEILFNSGINVYYSKIFKHPVELNNSNIEKERILYKQANASHYLNLSFLKKLLNKAKAEIGSLRQKILNLSKLP